VASFEETLRAINELKEDGIVEDYAIAGAMAIVFWIEPVPTYDLDVLIFLPSASPIVSLAPIYDWANEHNYPAHKEHIIVEGTPVQFVPSYSALADEAIENAVMSRYGNTDVSVVRPEYLIALYLEGSAKTQKRRERAAALRESGKVDEAVLNDVMKRFRLSF